MPKATLLIIGLLAAGAISSAQTSGDSYVMPKTANPNFYLEVGPSYIRSSDSDITEFFGGSVAFGWRIAKEHKVQIEVGYYASNTASESYSESGVGYAAIVTAKLDMTAMPVLVSYSYCIPLDTAGRSELRLTPTGGLMAFKAKMKLDVSGYAPGQAVAASGDSSSSTTTYAVGAGVGYTYHFSPKIYLDAGIRYLRTGKTNYNFDGVLPASMDALNTFTISASFGWKF